MKFRLLTIFCALFVAGCFLSPANGYAQSDSLSYLLSKIESASAGEVEFHSMSAIDSLEKKTRGKNELRGYRIQVFLGSYAEAKKLRASFQSGSTGLQAYIAQNSPDYVVRVGDFKTLFEAQKYLADLKKTYPSCLLVQDKIEPPRFYREKKQ